MGLSLGFTLRKVRRNDYTNPQWNLVEIIYYAPKYYFRSNLAHQCENCVAFIRTNRIDFQKCTDDNNRRPSGQPPVYKGH